MIQRFVLNQPLLVKTKTKQMMETKIFWKMKTGLMKEKVDTISTGIPAGNTIAEKTGVLLGALERDLRRKVMQMMLHQIRKKIIEREPDHVKGVLDHVIGIEIVVTEDQDLEIEIAAHEEVVDPDQIHRCVTGIVIEGSTTVDDVIEIVIGTEREIVSHQTEGKLEEDSPMKVRRLL